MSPPAPLRVRGIGLVALVGLGLLAWGAGLTHGLQGDDAHLLREFLRVRDAPPPFYAYFLSPSWGIFYRPLGTYLNDQLFAVFWPTIWPMHLLAFLVHAAGAFGVLRLARLAGARNGLAWLVSAIFITLPVHGEAVLWVAALHGMAENVCGLWAALLLIEGRRSAWRPWRVGTGVALYLCAVTMKESGLVALGVVALHDWFWRRDLHPTARRPAVLAAVYLPMFLGAAGVLLMRRAAYGGFSPFSLNTFDRGYLGAAALRVTVACLSPLPWRTVEGLLPPAARSPGLQLLLAAGAVVPVIALARARRRTALWLWLSLGGVLLPLLAVAVVPAERHLYLPAAFAAVLVALALERLLQSRPRALPIVALAAACWIARELATARQRVDAWSQADQHVRAVLEQTVSLVPRASADTLLVYLHVPDEVNGAFVFRFGNLGDFVRARYRGVPVQAQGVCTPAELPEALLDAPGMLRFTIAARGAHVYWPEHMRGGPFAPFDAKLVQAARLGKSWLLADWLRQGKPAHVLVYDAAHRRLRLADDALRDDVAARLLWIDYARATRLERYE